MDLHQHFAKGLLIRSVYMLCTRSSTCPIIYSLAQTLMISDLDRCDAWERHETLNADLYGANVWPQGCSLMLGHHTSVSDNTCLPKIHHLLYLDIQITSLKVVKICFSSSSPFTGGKSIHPNIANLYTILL